MTTIVVIYLAVGVLVTVMARMDGKSAFISVLYGAIWPLYWIPGGWLATARWLKTRPDKRK